MNIDKFLSTWTGTQSENRYNRLVGISLIAIVFLLVVDKISETPIVVVTPPNMAEKAVLGESKANKAYLESWALYMATLIGNVNPTSVNFLKDAIGPHLNTEIYQDVLDLIEIQSQDIRLDNIKRRFEHKTVEREGEKIFIYGHSYTEKYNGDEERNEITYEFIISIQNYKPVVDYIDTYESKPRTVKVLGSIKRSEESKKLRDEKRG